MSADRDLIATALGDDAFRFIEPAQAIGPLHVYAVELPPSYQRGLPPVWRFAVVHDGGQKDRALLDAILQSAQGLIRAQGRTDEAIPLIFLSSEALQLRNLLPDADPKVFILDADDLASAERKRPVRPRFAPFAVAVRRALGREEAALLMSPYIPDKPAHRWRFFGRQQEIKRLVYSPGNFIVVGGRRIGKTSLLQQVQIHLAENGQQPYFVDVQTLTDERQLVEAILQQLSLKDYASMKRRHDVIGDRMLSSSLKRIAGAGNAVLLIDEIGNVINKMRGNEWKILGTLRQYAHGGKLRIIATSSQEWFLKQADEYSGPWVNFGATMRLGGFQDEEIKDFVTEPLGLWAEMPSRRESLVDFVKQTVGTHPLLLVRFCAKVFELLARNGSGNPDIMRLCHQVVDTDLLKNFGDTVEEVFYRLPSPLHQYLFLSTCRRAEQKRLPVSRAELDDEALENDLNAIGLGSDLRSRRKILEGLETRGLTQPLGGNHGRQGVIAPLIYRYLCRAERDMSRFMQKLAHEAVREAPKLGLNVAATSSEATIVQGQAGAQPIR